MRKAPRIAERGQNLVQKALRVALRRATQRLSIRSRLLVVGSSLGDGVVVVLEPIVDGGGGRGHRS